MPLAALLSKWRGGSIPALVCLLLSLLCFVSIFFTHISESRFAGLTPVNTNIWDFGPVTQGGALEFQFRLQNTAPSAITIEHVDVACGCVVAKASAAVIPKNGFVTIDGHWKPGPSRYRVEQKVTIRYMTETESSELDLIVRGDVQPDFEYSPKALEFKTGVVDHRRIEFTDARVKGIRIIRATTTNGAFAASVSEDQLTVNLTFDPSKWEEDGPTPELRVDTNNVHTRRCRFPIQMTK